MAGSAFALPTEPPPHVTSTDGARPAFKAVVGDRKEPQSTQRPAFKAVVGDIKSDADRARIVAPVVPSTPAHGSAPAADSNDTGTIALIISIAAILTALGAVTLTVTRPHRGTVRA
jgi:hypothetical protein